MVKNDTNTPAATFDAQQLSDTYREKGWVVINGVYQPDEAEQLANVALEHVDNKQHADGTVEPRKVGNPFLKDQAFRDFALDQRLRQLLRALLGGKEPLLARDQVFMKPPRHGSAKPYHQDNAYFKCEPADELITAWIALDDVDEENGCLRYIDGSHKGAILEHKPLAGQEHNWSPDESQIDLSRESVAPVRKGGVVFHHGATLHTSHRNESDRWRRAYATHWVTADVTSTPGFFDDAPFNKPQYPDWAKPASMR